MSNANFMLSRVEHEKCFIKFGPFSRDETLLKQGMLR